MMITEKQTKLTKEAKQHKKQEPFINALVIVGDVAGVHKQTYPLKKRSLNNDL